MRITIDTTPLLFRSAGVKNYLYHWVGGLRAVGSRHSIATFPISSRVGRLDHERSQFPRAATVAGLARVHLLNRTGLAWRGAGVDVFHASHQLWNPPRQPRITATIYDLTCRLMPALHQAANVEYQGRFDAIMRRADGLIAISENTRQDAINLLGLAPERVTVIYPGVPEAYFSASPQGTFLRPYLLFVGTVEPRKNVGTLLDAWQPREDCELLIAGPAGWEEAKTLSRLRAGVPGVRYLGYVPEADLPALTAGALGLIYPSLYEGFGFPVAQAMAAGVPVITSNISSLPEVAGDAALLVDPRSPADLRSAITRLLDSPSLREQLGRNGRCRAARFRWEICARESIKFFERVAG